MESWDKFQVTNEDLGKIIGPILLKEIWEFGNDCYEWGMDEGYYRPLDEDDPYGAYDPDSIPYANNFHRN